MIMASTAVGKSWSILLEWKKKRLFLAVKEIAIYIRITEIPSPARMPARCMGEGDNLGFRMPGTWSEGWNIEALAPMIVADNLSTILKDFG